MKNSQRNKDRIKKAITTSYLRVHRVIIEGYISWLEAGVKYCLDNHDARHQRHFSAGDSYGWILLHDGEEIKRKIYVEGMAEFGGASESLDYVKGIAPQEGYVGIVLAGLKPANYFQVLYEFVPMRQAIRDLESDGWQKYFRPLK